ncbi:DUF748 domain-containing protein [Burkholderiaceae bacterium UC74_6]
MNYPWLRTLRRAALVLLGLVILILALTWIFLPRWVQGSGARLASEALGRQVQIQQVHFQPWRLGLVLEGVSIAGAPGQAKPLFAVDKVDAAVSLRSILHLAPVLSSLSVDRPVLRLARTGEGHFDIDDLIERFSKPKPKDAAKSEPPEFALYNIRVRGGEVRFDDQPVRREHVLSELQFDLPFISSFDADEKVEVQPAWGGKLGGVAFGGKGEALPFAEPPEASLDLHVDALDLAPYLGYVPKSLPAQLTQGVVNLKLKLRFAKSAAALSGDVGLSKFELQTPAGKPLAAWQNLAIGLKDVQPLHRQVLLSQVRWDGLKLALSPEALPAAESKPAPKKEEAKDAKPEAGAWRFGMDSFTLDGAEIAWSEAAARRQLKAEAVQMKIGAVQWPLAGRTPLSYGLQLQGAALKGEGSLSKDQLQLGLGWQALDLSAFAAWMPPSVPYKLKGKAEGQAVLVVADPLKAEAADRVELKLDGFSLANLAVANARGEALLDLAALKLDQAAVQLGAQRVTLGQLSVSKPVVQLVRGHDGRWRHDVPAGPAAPATSVPAGKPWTLELAGLNLDHGGVKLRDASYGDGSAEDTLTVDADAIQLQLGKLSWPADARPVPASLSLTLGAPQARANQRGTLQWKGQFGLAPLAASGQLRLAGLPLQWLDDALDPKLGLRLRRADLGWKGSFAVQQQPAGWQARADGDLQLADLRLSQLAIEDGKRVAGPSLLSWQTLNLDGMKLAVVPGKAPEMAIKQLRLDDFFASLLIDEKGKLNLQQLGGAPAPVGAASAPVTVAAAPAPANAASGPAMRVSVGSTLLSKGRVDFTDHFVRPNYSAQLSALEGSLGAFAADKPATAALQLRGKVAGTGLLDVQGQINPSVSPPEMDITASATDIELAPLSPYSGKYAGYEIERGKLSSKVHYKIESGGALQAENQLILNQLTFGNAIDSPDATKLPVRLAVALLKDRNGVIEINLPISGSVNDPQFSIGGLVWKAIINLIGKALTSPFSLFSGSGQVDMSQVAFAPGSGDVADPAQIEQIAKLMNERPAVTLSITGWADLERERAALQQRSLDEAIVAERRRELRRQQATADKEMQVVQISDADRDRLLKSVYSAAKLDKKPRNLIGLEKDLPPAEMKALLLPSYTVNAQRIHDLALARSVVVRDALIAKGVPNARIFLAAPKEGGELPQDWKPKADLKLGVD